MSPRQVKDTLLQEGKVEGHFDQNIVPKVFEK